MTQRHLIQKRHEKKKKKARFDPRLEYVIVLDSLRTGSFPLPHLNLCLGSQLFR